mmetsp:Transcript_28510/g.49424  ORF Transcript_28510/g.49424 Transcript_28510/m.49424 type:complete len:215 (+) Transcript_28510:1630-2274(+)
MPRLVREDARSRRQTGDPNLQRTSGRMRGRARHGQDGGNLRLDAGGARPRRRGHLQHPPEGARDRRGPRGLRAVVRAHGGGGPGAHRRVVQHGAEGLRPGGGPGALVRRAPAGAGGRPAQPPDVRRAAQGVRGGGGPRANGGLVPGDGAGRGEARPCGLHHGDQSLRRGREAVGVPALVQPNGGGKSKARCHDLQSYFRWLCGYRRHRPFGRMV